MKHNHHSRFLALHPADHFSGMKVNNKSMQLNFCLRSIALLSFLILINTNSYAISSHLYLSEKDLNTRQLDDIGFVLSNENTNADSTFYGRSNGNMGLLLTNTQFIWQFRGHSDEINRNISMRCINSNSNVSATGENEINSSLNMFLGNESSNWKIDVAHFHSVRYSQVYNGIDLVFHQYSDGFEFDFEIKPGTAANNIELDFGDSDSLIDSNGDLVVIVENNHLRFKKPLAYQLINGKRHSVSVEFTISSSNRVSFHTGNYDQEELLVIDPVVSYSTYLGAASDDRITSMAVDDRGNVYVTGFTNSIHFPIKHPFQSTKKGTQDVFVSKISSTGKLVYSTFLGGNGIRDTGLAIAVDSKGQAIIAGETFSSNFPVKAAIQPKLRGVINAFITKLSADGRHIVFSTYLGGSGGDLVNAIALDSADDIYLSGTADSPDFPVVKAIQTSIGGLTDAFVTKITSDGSKIVYSTFLGGFLDDYVTGVAVDELGQAYVTGSTESSNFPLKNALQTKRKGVNDGFIFKLSRTGSKLVFSTYIGGSGVPLIGGQDNPKGIAVDSTHNIWITGVTNSKKLPLVHELQNSLKGSFDAFVMKLNPRGSKLLFSTYLGGSATDLANSISLDSSGNAFIAGGTRSSDFPVLQPLQQFNQTGGEEAFVFGIDRTGTSIILSTFLGGQDQDRAQGIKVFNSTIFVSGYTSSSDFPLLNPIQSTKKGNLFSNDAFLTKIELVP